MCETQVQSPKCVFWASSTYFISRADKEKQEAGNTSDPQGYQRGSKGLGFLKNGVLFSKFLEKIK
jgi:hypothetical protein